jgi:hypothetical protein
VLALTDGAGLDAGSNRDALIILVLGSGLGALGYLAASLALGLDEPRELAARLPILSWFISPPAA